VRYGRRFQRRIVLELGGLELQLRGQLQLDVEHELRGHGGREQLRIRQQQQRRRWRQLRIQRQQRRQLGIEQQRWGQQQLGIQ
jgi:hypothetical protein